MQNRIKELRKARKISQKKMAADLGVAESTVQNWERDRTEMTGWSLLMVADYLGVSPSEVYGSGEPSQRWTDERELLDVYRGVSEEGRRALMVSARAILKEYPRTDGMQDSRAGLRGA